MFRLALGAQILAGRVLHVGIKRAHLQETTDPAGLGGRQGFLRQFHVRGAKARAIAAAFVEDPDQVDDRILAREEALQRGRVVGAALDQINLRIYQQVAVAVGAPRQHAHADTAIDQAADDLMADKAGAAEQADRANRINRHGPKVLPKAGGGGLILG